MDQREELEALRRMAELEAKAAKSRTQPAPDPSEGGLPFRPFGIDTGLTMPQGVSRFMAGAGKAFADLGRGVGQLTGNVSQREIDEAKRRDAPLMNTTGGTLGNIGGNVALALPAGLIPGAGTVAGGAAIGAGLNALQPTATGESRTGNVVTGAIAGGAIPAAVRAAKVLRAGFVDPFTENGRQRIVGNLLKRAAADPETAAQNMQNVRGTTPGFNPTAGQAAQDAGIASVERSARAIDPAGFGSIEEQQRASLINALRGIAKTPEDRAAASAAADASSKSLYGEAFKEGVPVTPELQRLAGKPSMQKAEARAVQLSKELGVPFNAPLSDMRPKTIYAGMRDLPDSRVTDLVSEYNPLALTTHQVEQSRPIPSGKTPTFVDIPPVDSVPVRDMHTLKMGMDALLSDPTLGIAGREAAAVKATRNRLLDSLPESYQKARLAHIEMNKPVNQMDIGQELYRRFVPAVADGADVPFRSRASAYAEALRNGDKLAQNVTGLKNAKLDQIMSPEQMATLNGVVKDSQLQIAAQNAGRGVGSDTVQKMAMSNLIDQAGLPSWITALAPLRPAGGMLKTAGDILYSKNDDTLRHVLADTLKNPDAAASAMKAAGIKPSMYAEYLKRLGQAGTLGLSQSSVRSPAVVNAE